MTARAKALIRGAKPQLLEPGQVPTQPSSTLRVFVAGLARLGYDTASLLSAAGVTAEQLNDLDGRVPCMSIPAVISQAMRIRPVKNLGIKLAAETPIGAFQLLDYLIVTCENVGQGMRQLARYLRLSEAPFSVEIYDTENPIRIVYVGIQDFFTAEFEIALAIFHLGRETGSRLQPEYVSFSQPPDDLREAELLLGSPVRTQMPWVGLALSRQDWELPLRRRDAALQSVLLRNAKDVAARLPEGNDVVADLRRILITRLPQGDSDIDSVARSMATSVRSLQRRLGARGTTYQEVLDATRREAAGRYLVDRVLSVSEVGYLLGYSEPAAFHRAFKRWHGSTPLEFRLAHRLRSGDGI
jgi:AraC-like DNA-binding protein